MSKNFWQKSSEFFYLAFLKLLVGMRNGKEEIRVIYRYYKNKDFAKADRLLLFYYLLKSPFTISKKFLRSRKEENLYQYGETPLTTLENIVSKAKLTADDVLLELGCGRGRSCFFLSQVIGCQTIGVDYIEEFIDTAKQIKQKCHLQKITFICQDFLEVDLRSVTCIYLYGSTLQDEYLIKLAKKLEALASGSKVITISFPLTDYAKKNTFQLVSCFSASFNWGEADVYIQYKI